MILVILGISLLILGVGITIYTTIGERLYHKDQEWIYYIINIIGATCSAVCIFVVIGLSVFLSNSMVIDDKINLYKTENANIEKQISTIVSEYKDYEQESFNKFKNESPTVLVSLFPELKSDNVVNKQIEVYVANNNKIKALQETKLDYKPAAWWLYFGG